MLRARAGVCTAVSGGRCCDGPETRRCVTQLLPRLSYGHARFRALHCVYSIVLLASPHASCLRVAVVLRDMLQPRDSLFFSAFSFHLLTSLLHAPFPLHQAYAFVTSRRFHDMECVHDLSSQHTFIHRPCVPYAHALLFSLFFLYIFVIVPLRVYLSIRPAHCGIFGVWAKRLVSSASFWLSLSFSVCSCGGSRGRVLSPCWLLVLVLFCPWPLLSSKVPPSQRYFVGSRPFHSTVPRQLGRSARDLPSPWTGRIPGSRTVLWAADPAGEAL